MCFERNSFFSWIHQTSLTRAKAEVCPQLPKYFTVYRTSSVKSGAAGWFIMLSWILFYHRWIASGIGSDEPSILFRRIPMASCHLIRGNISTTDRLSNIVMATAQNIFKTCQHKKHHLAKKRKDLLSVSDMKQKNTRDIRMYPDLWFHLWIPCPTVPKLGLHGRLSGWRWPSSFQQLGPKLCEDISLGHT